MKIEIRNDMAVVSGYVNAVGRDSRPITDVRGKFVEQIEPGAFRASLERSENVDLLLNHDKSRVYASTRDGSLKLTEDSIGLRAEAVLSDAEMIRKARSGEFRGWSFGMYVGDSAMEERAEGIPRRHVKSLNMFEVSLIDKSRIPCYVGTSVECRAEGEDVLAELRYSEEEPEIVEERSEPEPADYSAVDDVISELRYGAVDNVIAELRYNPYHDPSNGRFTSGGGGGGGVLVVEKGQKGKGVYVVDNSKFDNKEAENISAAQSEEFIKNSASLNRAEGKNAAHYLESYKAGDITEGEYKELMADLPRKVTENQKFTVNDRFGSHLVSGTTFEQNGEKFGVFSTGKSNDFVVDFSNGKSSPLKTTNSNGYALFSYSGKVSETAKVLKNIRRIAARSFDPVDSVIEELRYNPYHDPSTGRFASGGGGGGGGVLVVEQGQKGKGYYVVDVDHDEEYEKWKAEKDGGVSAADKAIQEATGGVVQKDEYTVVDAVMTRKNSKAAAVFDKTVLSADVDSNGNVVLKYAKGEYSGNYGDKVQDVQYKIKAGFVDDTPVNMDLSKATSLSGANTYNLRDVAKEAGLTWDSKSNSYIRKNHPLNTKTKFTSAELSAKSDSEIDAIYKSVFYKASIGKGHSLTAVDEKAKLLPNKSRAEKIALIEKYNSFKPGQDYRIRAF